MGLVPTKQEITENFRKNVTLKGWRESWKGTGAQPPVRFTGPQKELFDYLLELVREYEKARSHDLVQIKTKEEVMERASKARRIFGRLQGLSTLPPKSPLRPRVMPAFRREGFGVEHIIFESRPNYYVTGNLYLPKSCKKPYPAVLHVEGHSGIGKYAYQCLSSTLAKNGFAVFCIDPAGQGERDEYVDIATGSRTVRRACRMHGVAGDPAYLIGSNFGAYRLWDCMRSIDYLLSRKDIDGAKIGVTGSSGGGWESLWIGAIDTRIKAINSNCYLTTWRRRMENRGADPEPDPEQDPFGVLAEGLDAGDLIVACAPCAVSLGATIFDFFPVDGAINCFAEARSLFRIAGIEDRLAIRVVDAGHGMTQEMREFCCEWMQRWLKGEKHPDVSEPEWVEEERGLINCTRTGIVLTSLGGKTTAQLNAERARELALTRPSPKTAKEFSQRAKTVKRELRRLLRFESIASPLEQKEGKSKKVGRLIVTPLKIKSSGNLWLQAYLWKNPDKGKQSAVIYLAEKREDYDPMKNRTCQGLASAGAVVLDLDPRGMGPLKEIWLDFVPLIESDLTYDAFLLGRTLLGMRVVDVMRGLEALRAREEVGGERIGLYGDGYGALLGLFSACLDERISHLIERRALTSYSSLVWNRDYAWPVNVILPCALQYFDLEDVRAALAPRPLVINEPLDHHKKPLSVSEAERQYARVKSAYEAAGVPGALTILPGRPNALKGRVSWAMPVGE